MGDLPSASGREIVRALERAGFVEQGQRLIRIVAPRGCQPGWQVGHEGRGTIT